MREPRIFTGHDMPEVEVLIDNAWYFGDLRMWSPNDDGTWTAHVTYNLAAGERRIDSFPAHHVRAATNASHRE